MSNGKDALHVTHSAVDARDSQLTTEGIIRIRERAHASPRAALHESERAYAFFAAGFFAADFFTTFFFVVVGFFTPTFFDDLTTFLDGFATFFALALVAAFGFAAGVFFGLDDDTAFFAADGFFTLTVTAAAGFFVAAFFSSAASLNEPLTATSLPVSTPRFSAMFRRAFW